ncbi:MULTISPECIES: hypothetical protein [Leptospira]|uniref:Lipoprotein n=1 Tax=Leptospira weilii str. 2006001853 TaxID=1001589 RepID=A0A828YZQ7_9LEPT|nr:MULTISPECIES: hypothetical protein [Leptospira]EKR63273.1 hypothetical protein LEP1GSC036_3040 [Leptospira weilii str. 2006001853]EMJ67566.1 hypothetical protein LEP1GSC051_2905 [Leptospira sp. P2653]EMN43600.1 hypothetical protein LEP1GSC086_0478 [Leptospira weilii str. LNT 1234]QDK22655.1 hypothetical protein FHG67_08025 [Leptospira weilii]QDK27700.1 hypothetical protein FHG68_14210 [Leptospira weilii]
MSQCKEEDKNEKNTPYRDLTEALQNPTDVRFLELGDQFTTIPNEIGKLQNLIGLHLDDIPALRSQEEKIRKLLPKVNIIFIEIKE